MQASGMKLMKNFTLSFSNIYFRENMTPLLSRIWRDHYDARDVSTLHTKADQHFGAEERSASDLG